MPDMENVINGLKVVGGYLDMKSYTDNIAFNLIPHIKAAIALLKEQEEDIIAMSRFLESHGWDSDSICGKNVEIVVTNGDDDDA